MLFSSVLLFVSCDFSVLMLFWYCVIEVFLCDSCDSCMLVIVLLEGFCMCWFEVICCIISVRFELVVCRVLFMVVWNWVLVICMVCFCI